MTHPTGGGGGPVVTGGGSHHGKSRGGGVTPRSWAVSLLHAIGAPDTQANVESIVGWEAAEGGNWNNTAAYNPLNTTQQEPGSSTMNSVGVQSYTSWSEGLNATVQTLQNGNYGDVLTALRSGKGLMNGTYSGLATWSGGAYDTVSPHPGYGGGGVGVFIGQGAGANVSQADPSTCLYGFSGINIPFFGPYGSSCWLSKSQARAIAAVGIMLFGGSLLLGGGFLLASATATTLAAPVAAVLGPSGKVASKVVGASGATAAAAS